MVKLLNTPFGNYGYVLNRDLGVSNFPLSVSDINRGNKFSRIRPSVYDARYLRTTDLAKGSFVMKISDPQSYVKHGLLHDGQEKAGNRTSNMLSQSNSSRSHFHSMSVESSRSKADSTIPSVRKLFVSNKIPKDAHFAGRSTIVRHHKNFALNYAASRSMANYFGEDVLEEVKDGSSDEDEDEDEDEKKLRMLVPLDPKGKSLTELNKLKTKRLNGIYTDMYENMERKRRSLIMERVQTAEKIKNVLHNDELEEQRKLLKSSVVAQRRQLLKVRSKHDKTFSTRLNSLYTTKSSKIGYQPAGNKTGSDVPNPTFLSLSLPRETFGLPEANSEKRPESVPTKHIYRFKPGKLLLSSYDQTRNTLPTKFNNVWTKGSPATTPRKLAIKTTEE